MQSKSFQDELRERIARLALVVADGGTWTKEQAEEAAQLGEFKQTMAAVDGKTRLAQRLEGQITTLRKKV